MANGGNEARIAQTRRTFHRLRTEIGGWSDARERADTSGQHRTQLTTLRDLFRTAIDCLTDQFKKTLEVRPEEGELYLECREFDRRVSWVGRAWEFYRHRFDQRDTDQAKATLSAADEVVWSCFGPVIQNARDHALSVPSYPAPLPCLEPDASPSAFPPTVVADELRGWLRNPDRDPRTADLLAETLRELPVPLVRVPTTAAYSPWLLVLLAHEVGHHVEFALGKDAGLVLAFRTGLGQAVEAVDPDQWGKWAGWAIEVFANVFSVLAVGPMAARALADLIAAPPRRMAQGTTDYPPSAVRLALMVKAAEVSGLVVPALPGLAAFGATPTVDPSVIEAVVKYALGALPGVGLTMAELLDFDPKDFSPEKEDARVDLVTAEHPRPDRQPKTARLLAAAGYAAWLRVNEGGLAIGFDDLADRISRAIVASATEEVRSVGPGAEQIESEVTKAAGVLADLAGRGLGPINE